ncbi:hypothetical protein DL764_006388 [Monosporascus ibericus]|uniref:FAD-binding PCMH-type domain-containing protein n=1 Tax=Monosporascus ibericus TaxID=155417 RepID=A0A4V1XA38_9PEZI|nr:hypothetical protein DL764_006388 [Monosporascus ibericus]
MLRFGLVWVLDDCKLPDVGLVSELELWLGIIIVCMPTLKSLAVTKSDDVPLRSSKRSQDRQGDRNIKGEYGNVNGYLQNQEGTGLAGAITTGCRFDPAAEHLDDRIEPYKIHARQDIDQLGMWSQSGRIEMSAEQPELSGIELVTPPSSRQHARASCDGRRTRRSPWRVGVPPPTSRRSCAYCAANGVDFVIRGGGHDCAGRTQVRGAPAIDICGLDHVRIADDGKTAAMGGGVILRNLTRVLDGRGLATPVGVAVLASSWSAVTTYGLGADQIVGAKLVNLKGELVDADGELLKGIRGGGGIFGVIVELTIKIYPLKEIYVCVQNASHLLVSLLIFESSDLKTTWTTYAEALEKLVAEQPLPNALQLQHLGVELPNLGKVLAVGATWADPDHEEGRGWMGKIASLGNCLVNNPEPRPVTAYIEANEAMLTFGSCGRTFTVSMRKLTPKSAEVLARHTALLPAGCMAISAHMLHAPAPSEDSVFGCRVEHHMLELLTITPQQDLETKGAEWARELARDLRESDPDNVLDSPYVALVGDDDADYRRIYGSHYDALVTLKRKYDPDNVFKYAVPPAVRVMVVGVCEGEVCYVAATDT